MLLVVNNMQPSTSPLHGWGYLSDRRIKKILGEALRCSSVGELADRLGTDRKLLANTLRLNPDVREAVRTLFQISRESSFTRELVRALKRQRSKLKSWQDTNGY